MAGTGNRKRGNKKTETVHRSLWGGLFHKSTDEGEDFMRRSFFSRAGEEEYEEPENAPQGNILQELWHKFNFWSILATLLFLSFTLFLVLTMVYMWTPQNMQDIAGYKDKGVPRDLTALLRNAGGAPISFTEAEINRYLRDTCRIRQTGLFSIITHGQGVALRIHDGYAEIIIDRIIGTNIHQTTSVHLSFTQEVTMGKPGLRIDFKGGTPLLGKLPRGGSIGCISVPQRYVQMLRPALETLLSCYPEISGIMAEHGYKPIFVKGTTSEFNRVDFVPYYAS